MIRRTTHQPTATCTLPIYMGFLMSEPKHATCRHLGTVMGISHDSVNRFLLRERYEPQDLYQEAKSSLNLVGGTLTVDDSVLDKPYAFKMELVGYYWSGKHHRTVKGINLITLYYTDPQGRHLPVNYRVYDKADRKTKNDYFQEMLLEVLAWGLRPAFVTGDTWYACEKNLKTVKHHGMGFLFAVESNRTVSLEKGAWAQVQTLDVPDDGVKVWLREFGEVKLFRTTLKDQRRHYLVYQPNDQDYTDFRRRQFLELHDRHWQIEQYHRAIKQVCNIERFQVRTGTAILNHIFAALCSFVFLQKMQASDLIENVYAWKRELYNDVIATFIRGFVPAAQHLNTQLKGAVNA